MKEIMNVVLRIVLRVLPNRKKTLQLPHNSILKPKMTEQTMSINAHQKLEEPICEKHGEGHVFL
jgi:hypothetical protein